MTRPPAPAGDQQGIATIEFVAVVWTFMVVVLGAAQFGLWWHAQHVVLAAAQDAARLAAAEDGTPRRRPRPRPRPAPRGAWPGRRRRHRPGAPRR